MTTSLRVSDVFVPGLIPEFTYNPRAGLQLEEDFETYLRETGGILAVAGPTKTGKTVLVHSVLETLKRDAIILDGQSLTDVDSMWRLIVDEMGAYSDFEVSKEGSSTGTGSITSEAGFMGIGKIGASAEYSATDSASQRYGISRPLGPIAKKELIATKRALVIDDFHFIPRSIQRDVVRALKPLTIRAVPIVLVSIMHRIFDALEAEPDMEGRIDQLRVEHWSHDELKLIATKGFQKLNIIDRNYNVTETLARESYGSPHLMQLFCREICKASGISIQEDSPQQVSPPGDWQAFFQKHVEQSSKGWFERLLRGPQERGGKSRTEWTTNFGIPLDGYGLTLLGIRETGPKLYLTKEAVRVSIEKVAQDGYPQMNQTTRVLQHMSNIASKKMSELPLTTDELDEMEAENGDSWPEVQPVVEYMHDGVNQGFHIANPFFASFLRWGTEHYLGKADDIA